MTTLAALTDWLDRYEQAWRTNDADQIRDLFTEDAVYRWHPWEDPADGADGREEIVEAWLEQPDDPDDWTLDCERWPSNGDVGVARCVTRYRATARGQPASITTSGSLTLTEDGRCSDFTRVLHEGADRRIGLRHYAVARGRQLPRPARGARRRAGRDRHGQPGHGRRRADRGRPGMVEDREEILGPLRRTGSPRRT